MAARDVEPAEPWRPPLRTTQDIRVLTILPRTNSADSDILLTRLESISLDRTAHFDALSYVWGRPNGPNHPILCNGAIVNIPINLHAALRKLADHADRKPIWIDQLCINQDDTLERNHQVALMGVIYSQADKVIVWLGEQDNATPLVWELLDRLAALRNVDRLDAASLALEGKKRSANPHLPDLPPGRDTCWKSVATFFNRAWFQRMWTFQEVVLSTQCEVHCGSYSMGWLALHNAVIGMNLAGYDRYIDQAGTNVESIERRRGRRIQGRTAPFRELLVETRRREATNPRDMVYAVRSVLDPQIATRLKVDYGASLEIVFADAVRVCIEFEDALTILGAVEYRRNKESLDQMPSWVPDWRYQGTTNVDLNLRRLDGTKYYNASLGLKPMIVPSHERTKLCLQGLMVAEITNFYEVRRQLKFLDLFAMGSRRFPDERFEIASWQSMYEEACQKLESSFSGTRRIEVADHLTSALWSKRMHDLLSEKEELEMAYRRTVTADLYPRPGSRLVKKETSVLFPSFLVWEAAGFPRPIPVDVLHEYDYYVTQVMCNREFFVAKQVRPGDSITGAQDNLLRDYMGIVMGVPRHGDCICMFRGGDTPFVLRPLGTSEWQLIGEAYVHGIMDGEAVDDAAVEANDFWEGFVLV